MGAVKSVGRVFKPSRAPTLPKHPVRSSPQPSSGDPATFPNQPSPELLDKLKEVYVESTSEIITQENPYASERLSKSDKLPQDRHAKYEDGFHVERSSEGYLTVQQVLEMFAKRREKQSEWTPNQVANKYNIDPTDAENLLKYFNNYRILATHKPDTELKYHPLHR